MIIYRLRSETLVYDLYLPEKSNGKVLLYFPGLPGHPRKKSLGEQFSIKGFTFIEMRFPGSWESDGKFTMDNCVNSVEEAYNFVQQGNAVELRRGSKIEWQCDEITLIGSSFGGGVVLSSHLKDPLTFLLLAPVTKLKHINDSLIKLSLGEDDLFHLLSQGYSNVYRGLTRTDWQNFLDGKTLLNPEANIRHLKNKRLFFFQGTTDKVIGSDSTEEYVQELKAHGVQAQFINVSDVGHGSELEEKAVDLIVPLL